MNNEMEDTCNDSVVTHFGTHARNLPVQTKITKKLRAAENQPAKHFEPTISRTISTTVSATLFSYKPIKALSATR
jgi:hypothetical protein